MKILLATHNQKKLAELRKILDNSHLDEVELITLADLPPYEEPVESGASFEENALIKSRDGAKRTGYITIADDSGIAIDALNGMPGILSARWSGNAHSEDKDRANYELVLAQMKDIPDQRRGAAFVSVCALSFPESHEQSDITVRGEWGGKILHHPRGDHGFGYDPIFEPVEYPGFSAAELSVEQKNSLSHRARSLEQLVPFILELVKIESRGV